MIREYDGIDRKELYEVARSTFAGRGPVRISILGWQGGHYFSDLCNERGGAKSGHESLFRQISGFSEFFLPADTNSRLDSFIDLKYLGSVDESYRFIYDIHLIGQGIDLCYCPFLGKIRIAKIGTLRRLLGQTIDPGWADQSLVISPSEQNNAR